MPAIPRVLGVVFALTLILFATGCGMQGGSPDPTVTPDDLFVIVTPTPGLPLIQTPTPAMVTQYTVQPGDSLLEIAVRFRITLNALQAANGIQDPNSIFAGQVLKIPAPEQ